MASAEFPLIPRSFDHTPIVIATCAKVGSKSIRWAIVRSLTCPLHDLHYLQDCLWRPPADLPADLAASYRAIFADQDAEARRVRAGIIEPDAPARIITAVRDPIAQGVSMFFQFFDWHQRDAIDDPERAARRAIPAFVEQWRPRWMQDWFDREFPAIAGTAIDRLPIDPTAGGGQAIHGRRAILLLRCEDPMPTQRRRLECFLNTRPLTFDRQHTTDDKPWGPVYRAFLRLWRPDEDALHAAFGQPVIRQCYTPGEIETMTRRWRASIPAHA